MNADMTTTATAQLATGFSGEPSVVFQPANTKIARNEQGSVKLSIGNPDINKATLHVFAEIYVPPNLCVYSLSGGVTGGGTSVVTAMFDIAPGKHKTVEVFMQPTRTGVYILDCNTTYYPVGHEELASHIPSSCEITVEVTPTPIVTPTPEPKHVPVFEAMFVLAGVLGAFYLLMRKK